MPAYLGLQAYSTPGFRNELSIKQEGFLGMDGVSTERIVPGDMVRICRSRRSVRFIRLSDPESLFTHTK